jgi:hypothetical protein
MTDMSHWKVASAVGPREILAGDEPIDVFAGFGMSRPPILTLAHLDHDIAGLP